MGKNEHKSCYGAMFPAVSRFSDEKGMSAKVLSLGVRTPVGVVPRRRKVTVNLEEWNDCLECLEFERCYKLCMGSVILEAVIAND